MTPVIRPIHIPEPDETEYRREQERFARMQVEFHARNAERLRGRFVKRWASRILRATWRVMRGAPGGLLRHRRP